MSATTTPIPSGAPARAVLGDAAFSMCAKMLYLVTRLGLPPLILAHVSLTQYGLWSACFILIGYIGVADLGFSSVYVRGAAHAHVSGDTRAIGVLLSTGIACMCVIAALVFSALWALMPSLLGALHIAPPNQAVARLLMQGCVAVFLIDLCTNGLVYVLHGMQEFRREQRTWMQAYLLEMALIVVFLQAGMGVSALLLAFALRYLFSIASNVRQVYRALPGLALGWRYCERAAMRHFFSFGLRVQAGSLCAIALHSADRVLAGLLLGPQAIALFELGAKLPVSTSSVPGAITQMTLPAAARLGAVAAIRALYAQNTRAVSIAAAVPLAFLAAFATPVCFAWLGGRPELAVLAHVMALSALACALHIATGPGTSVFRAMGQLHREFVYHGLRVLCIGAALAVGAWRGALDVPTIAAALCCAMCVAALVYHAHNHRLLGLPIRELFTRVLLPTVPCWLSAGVLLLLWSALVPGSLGRWPTLALVGIFAAVHCALAALGVWVCLDRTEQGHLLTLAAPWLNRWKNRRVR